MERSYRPLLPSKASSGSEGHAASSPPEHGLEARRKRQQIIVACQSCRKRKSKCDGQRPTCNACHNKKTCCTWTADPDAPPIVALKRKYDILKRESQDLRNLVDTLRKRPEEEAQDILRLIRAADDLTSVYKLLKEDRTVNDDSDAGDSTSHKRRASTVAVYSARSEKTGPLDELTSMAAPLSAPPSDAGSLGRSPSLTPSTLSMASRKGSIRIQDLLNDGPTNSQYATSSVHSRNGSRDSDGSTSSIMKEGGFVAKDQIQQGNSFTGFRAYG